MQCQNCNREIPNDAVLCPYCGHRVSREEPPPSVPPARKRMNSWMWVVVIGGIAIVACLACFALAVFQTSTPTYEATATAKAAARQTETARPTDTPIPAPTPIPTDTPVPITYADIEHNYDTLTDIQWKSYAEGLKGRRVHWVAEVREVKGDLTTFLDVGQGFLNSCYLEGLSMEEASALSKGDVIEFEATIRKVDRFLGLSVWLDNPVLISVR